MLMTPSTPTPPLQNQNPFPLTKYHIHIESFVFFPLPAYPHPLTCLCGRSNHVTIFYLPHNQEFSNCKKNSLLSMHKNMQCAINTFWKWGPREVFSMKSNLHFSATNASFLLRRIICTTDL